MRGPRVLIVFEFPPGDAEWQLRDVADHLQALDPSIEVSVCAGWLAQYSPGGLSLARVANGAWVHLRAFAQILAGPYDAVLVRSAPPLIQMTVAAACRLTVKPFWVWLMDAHPEIEAEIWGRRPVLGSLCRALVRLNRRVLAAAELVIVLDDAMRQRLLPGHDECRVVICPTWGQLRSRPQSLVAK